ncbi:MAG: hypothetical protein QXQ54_08495 [Thermoplasmata archaeon]
MIIELLQAINDAFSDYILLAIIVEAFLFSQKFKSNHVIGVVT